MGCSQVIEAETGVTPVVYRSGGSCPVAERILGFLLIDACGRQAVEQGALVGLIANKAVIKSGKGSRLFNMGGGK